MSRIGTEWTQKSCNSYHFGHQPFKQQYNYGIQDSLFWELSNVASMQGRLLKKSETGRKQDIWREGWYILVKRQLWVFPMPNPNSSNAEKNDITICPGYYHLGGDPNHGVTTARSKDSTTFCLTVTNRDAILRGTTKLSTTQQTQTLTFQAKTSHETDLWIEKINNVLNTGIITSSRVKNHYADKSTDLKHDNQILSSIDFMIQQSQSDIVKEQCQFYEKTGSLSDAIAFRELRDEYQKFLAREHCLSLWYFWQFAEDFYEYNSFLISRDHPLLLRANHTPEESVLFQITVEDSLVLGKKLYSNQGYFPMHLMEWIESIFKQFLLPLKQTTTVALDMTPPSPSPIDFNVLMDSATFSSGLEDGVKPSSTKKMSKYKEFTTSSVFQESITKIETFINQINSRFPQGMSKDSHVEIDTNLFRNCQHHVWLFLSMIYEDYFIHSKECRDLLAYQDLSTLPTATSILLGIEEESDEEETEKSNGEINASTASAAGNANSVVSWLSGSFRRGNKSVVTAANGTSGTINGHIAAIPPKKDMLTKWRESLWTSYNKSTFKYTNSTKRNPNRSPEQWWIFIMITRQLLAASNGNQMLECNLIPIVKSKQREKPKWMPIQQNTWLFSQSVSTSRPPASKEHCELITCHFPQLMNAAATDNANNVSSGVPSSAAKKYKAISGGSGELASNELAYYVQDYEYVMNTLDEVASPTSILSSLSSLQLRGVHGIVFALLNMKCTYFPLTAQEQQQKYHQSMYGKHRQSTSYENYESTQSRQSFSDLVGFVGGSNRLGSATKAHIVDGSGDYSPLGVASSYSSLMMGNIWRSNRLVAGGEDGPSGRRPSFSFSPNAIVGTPWTYDEILQNTMSSNAPSSSALPPQPTFQQQKQLVVFCMSFGVPYVKLLDPISQAVTVSIAITTETTSKISPADNQLYTIEMFDEDGRLAWQLELEQFEDYTVVEQLRISLTRWCYYFSQFCRHPPSSSGPLQREEEITTAVASNNTNQMAFFPTICVHNIIKRGYLQKRGKVNTSYKWRWFELCTDLKLRYFKDEVSRVYKGFIDLVCVDSNINPITGHLESVVRVDKEIVLAMNNSNRIWYLRAEDEGEVVEWVLVINQLLFCDPIDKDISRAYDTKKAAHSAADDDEEDDD